MSKLFKALALAGAMISCAPVAAAQTPGGFVDVPGGKLWYETCGSGPAMVLIHDGVLHSAAWDDVWPALCKSFHVIRYDRRGYGRSPEAQAPYSPIDDLQAVLQAADVKHAVIVGASNGGGLAVDFTLAHPAEVDRLVLIGADVSGVAHTSYFFDRLIELQGRIARGEFAAAIKGSWLFPPEDDADAARLLKLEMASPQDLNHKDPATPRPPAAPRLGEIKAPTLVLVGESDQADNQAEAGVLEFAIHGAKRQVIPNAGHLIYMTRPAEFTEVVSRFASGTEVATPGTEEALRRLLEELRQGAPDYSRMSPALADNVRPQVDRIKGALTALGPIRSVTFKAVGPGGADIYTVAYATRSAEWAIKLGQGGRIEGAFFKPLP